MQISECHDPEKIKKILTDDFNAEVDKMVERSLELPTSYVSNAPFLGLSEATECFIHGFFNASIALSRTTLEQALKDRLGIGKDEVVDLTCLIKLATAQRVLSNNLKSDAIKVQRWGNAYIHDTKKKDAEYKKQKSRSKEVLLSLKRIIESFYPTED